MKVANAETHVLGSHGLTETKAFNIRTNAHAFKLLSSGLYSDKIAAVLREIGCNAYDAHVEYGCPDLPIIVKLPNRIDAQFYIRDMGPGLSHEDVMELYTTYFASTKQNSNDYTGAFGLGSKSPFSYTDQFTVTSVHSGIKRTYSAYLDNKGSPTIAKLAEVSADNDWQHGVQISFPVKPDDLSLFEARAQNIFRWFRTPPQIEGARAIQPIKPQFENIEFAYYPGNTGGAQASVLMGNVFYPINLTVLGTDGLIGFMNIFQGIVLKLKIGEVQVAASREELQYDDDSKKVLRAKLDDAIRLIGTDIADTLRKAKTWEEKCAAKSAGGTWVRAGSIYNNTWRDFFVTLGFKDAQTLAGLATTEYIGVPTIMGVTANARIITMNQYGRQALKVKKVISGKLDGYVNNHAIYLKKNTVVYFGKKILALTRCSTLLREQKMDQVLLFTPSEEDNTLYTVANAEAEARAVADILGITKVEDIATVPLPANYVKVPAKKRVKKGATPPPLPTQAVVAVDLTRRQTTQDISKLSKEWQNFMVLSKSSGRHRSNQYRIYETTADTDVMIENDMWDRIIKNTNILSAQIGCPILGYTLLAANDVKKLDLIKRGWPTTYGAIKEWLTAQSTRDTIIKIANTWKPSMSLDDYHAHGWAGELILLRHKDDALYGAIRPHLVKEGIDSSVQSIWAESLKQQGKGTKEPVIITAYRDLCSIINGLAPIQMNKSGNYISVDDFAITIRTKYPLTQMIDHRVFRNVYQTHPSRIEGFVKLFIS